MSRGGADAGAIGDPYWARALGDGLAASGKAKAFWTSPRYRHCNFTVRSDADVERFGPGRPPCWRWTTTTQPIARLWTWKVSSAGFHRVWTATRLCLEAVEALNFFGGNEERPDETRLSDLS